MESLKQSLNHPNITIVQVEDIKLLFKTIGALMRGNALAPFDKPVSNPIESLKRL